MLVKSTWSLVIQGPDQIRRSKYIISYYEKENQQLLQAKHDVMEIELIKEKR